MDCEIKVKWPLGKVLFAKMNGKVEMLHVIGIRIVEDFKNRGIKRAYKCYNHSSLDWDEKWVAEERLFATRAEAESNRRTN